MSKIKWKAGTFEYPIPAALVTSGTMENSNVMTVAWTGVLNTDPAMVYISVRPSRYSYDLIKFTNIIQEVNQVIKVISYIISTCVEYLLSIITYNGTYHWKSLIPFKHLIEKSSVCHNFFVFISWYKDTIKKWQFQIKLKKMWYFLLVAIAIKKEYFLFGVSSQDNNIHLGIWIWLCSYFSASPFFR